MSTLPPTMKPMRLTGYGGLDRLVPTEVRTPCPEPGKVAIWVGARGFGNSAIYGPSAVCGKPHATRAPGLGLLGAPVAGMGATG